MNDAALLLETNNGECDDASSDLSTITCTNPQPAHSNTHSYDITGRPSWVGAIIYKKLSKINEIDAKLSTVIQKVHIMETDITNLKKTTGILRKTSEEIKGQICELEKAQQAMEDSITDLQSRSIREKLLFFGLAEYKGKRKENCVSLIGNFC